MKFDRVNTSAYAFLWPIIDCLLAPSPRVKQKSRLLKNLLKLQVSLVVFLCSSAVFLQLNVCFSPFVAGTAFILFLENKIICLFLSE